MQALGFTENSRPLEVIIVILLGPAVFAGRLISSVTKNTALIIPLSLFFQYLFYIAFAFALRWFLEKTGFHLWIENSLRAKKVITYAIRLMVFFSLIILFLDAYPSPKRVRGETWLNEFWSLLKGDAHNLTLFKSKFGDGDYLWIASQKIWCWKFMEGCNQLHLIKKNACYSLAESGVGPDVKYKYYDCAVREIEKGIEYTTDWSLPSLNRVQSFVKIDESLSNIYGILRDRPPYNIGWGPVHIEDKLFSVSEKFLRAEPNHPIAKFYNAKARAPWRMLFGLEVGNQKCTVVDREITNLQYEIADLSFKITPKSEWGSYYPDFAQFGAWVSQLRHHINQQCGYFNRSDHSIDYDDEGNKVLTIGWKMKFQKTCEIMKWELRLGEDFVQNGEKLKITDPYVKIPIPINDKLQNGTNFLWLKCFENGKESDSIFLSIVKEKDNWIVEE
jgi:hypothetical protein